MRIAGGPVLIDESAEARDDNVENHDDGLEHKCWQWKRVHLARWRRLNLQCIDLEDVSDDLKGA